MSTGSQALPPPDARAGDAASSSPPAGEPGRAAAPPRRRPGALGPALRRSAALLWAERSWLLILIPYALACWLPLAYSAPDWSPSGSPVAFQALVPLAAALLVWQRRARLRSQWQRLQVPSPSGRVRHRSGNLFPLAAGCALLLFAFLVHVNSFFALGLILMLVGVVYYLYGPVILKELAVPLALLLLTVDPPASLISITQGLFCRGTASAVTGLLTASGVHATAAGSFVNMTAYALEIKDGLSGASLFGIMLLLALTYALYTRRSLAFSLCLIVFTGALTLFAHLLRVALVARTSVGAPDLSQMAAGVSPWLSAVLLSALVLYGLQLVQLALLRYQIAERRQAHRRQSETITGRVDRALDPVFRASGAGAQRLAAQQRRLTKRIDGLFDRLLAGRGDKKGGGAGRRR